MTSLLISNLRGRENSILCLKIVLLLVMAGTNCKYHILSAPDSKRRYSSFDARANLQLDPAPFKPNETSLRRWPSMLAFVSQDIAALLWAYSIVLFQRVACVGNPSSETAELSTGKSEWVSSYAVSVDCDTAAAVSAADVLWVFSKLQIECNKEGQLTLVQRKGMSFEEECVCLFE